MRFFQGSPDLSLTLSTSLASAQSLLHPPNSSPAVENLFFPELLHILPSSLFPPEWSHWLPTPPSALNWLGTDPKIPPSQQLLWANREAIQYPCSSALGVTVIHRVPSRNAEHMPGTHPIHTASSKECGHLYSGRLFLCLLLPAFALFLNHFQKFPLHISIENLGKP